MFFLQNFNRLFHNNKAALTGAYKTAGGLATGKVDLANYGLVVDAAYGGTAIAQK